MRKKTIGQITRKMQHRERNPEIHNLRDMDRLAPGDRIRAFLSGESESRLVTVGSAQINTYQVIAKEYPKRALCHINSWETDESGLIFNGRGIVEFDKDRTTFTKYGKDNENYIQSMELIHTRRN